MRNVLEDYRDSRHPHMHHRCGTELTKKGNETPADENQKLKEIKLK